VSYKQLKKAGKDKLKEILYKLQNGLCPICYSPLGDRMALDHNHMNDKIRGVLCPKCNLGLGSFNDNPQILLNAINYLKKDGGK
jgi:hypothetical protein